MSDRMEKLVLLPFSIGCVSEASVAVGTSNLKKTKPEPKQSFTRGECVSGGKTKNSLGFIPLQKPNVSASLQRMTKSFKNFSHLFVYKEEDMEEVEMEIGFPTDVKHVTHIGWDGPTTTTTMMKGWDEFKAPDLVSLPATSLRQFEHAMAAQSDVPHVNDSSVRLT
ncbi:hypothetical protein AAC387_Pa01g1947 [Persea americana]